MPLHDGLELVDQLSAIVILLGLARRTARQNEKVSLFYGIGPCSAIDLPTTILLALLQDCNPDASNAVAVYQTG